MTRREPPHGAEVGPSQVFLLSLRITGCNENKVDLDRGRSTGGLLWGCASCG